MGGEWKGHGRAGHSRKSRVRRAVIGVGELSEDGSRERREMIGEGGIVGRKRSESGSVQTQDLFEVVGETKAAAEGCGCCAWCEGRARCSCRETRRSPRGRKGNTGERRETRRSPRGRKGNTGERRETRRNPRGRKGNTGERRRERGKDRGTGGGDSDGMEHQPPGHLGDGRTMSLAVARFVQEGGVPTRREIGCGCKVAGLRG